MGIMAYSEAFLLILLVLRSEALIVKASSMLKPVLAFAGRDGENSNR